MFLSGGLAQRLSVAQARFCDVVEKSPDIGWGVATASSAFPHTSIICYKFAMKMVWLLLGQSCRFNEPNLYYVFVAPLRLNLISQF